MNIESRNRIIIFISFFTALTAIGAFIKIPLPHIPITLQTFFVIMSGNMLGYKFGTLSQILYLILGLIGIPIFAYGGGPGYIFQPTFGYLLGYPICAFSIGILLRLFFFRSEKRIISRQKTFFAFFLADMFGVLIIFIFGLAYLSINLKLGLYLRLEQFASASINWKASVKVVVLMFIPIDLVKAFLASWLTVHLKQLIKFNLSF
jgi:biotin transport system substrate-specific component